MYNVLCFLDNPLGRDTEIVLPVAYTLEKYFDCKIEFLFIWDIYAIKRKEPDVVLLPNAVGHHMYFEIAKYASENQIIVLALESEGNFRTDGSFNYWGYNTDKYIYQQWLTAWSPRTKRYLEDLLEEQKDKVIETGGTGFDRYIFSIFRSREELLKKYGKERYKKVIGYAGWAFGKAYSKHKLKTFLHIHPDPEVRLAWVERNRLFVKGVLKELIENNTDTLFILKRHPKESWEDDPTEGPNEMNELLDYPNVLYIRKEEMVHDLISISDVWLGFETTTAIESWLLGKETILINEDVNFKRNELYQGSIIVNNYESLQNLINEHYSKGQIASFYFEELKNKRTQLIRNSIGYMDGLNHLRAAYWFAKSLKARNSKQKVKYSLRHLRLYFLMHVGKYFFIESIFKYLPGFKKSIYVFKAMNLPGFKERKEELYAHLQDFHDKNGVTEKIKSGNLEDLIVEHND